ncbi:LPXTG cell wall anchor domain-containing protein, partial [Dactylosporangium sp. NPDC000555]|uniref:LPXTG cell wall anchor domain-containing protein n=1 Tax=Dactylosporangium sp. NPDC000555 TaxID=3154260 RepID=UPI00332538EB
MKNMLFRRVAAGTFAAVAAVSLSTLFATTASAHSAGPAGVAKCGDDGKYVITWTVQNDFGTPVKLSNIKILPGDETHADISLGAHGKDSFQTTYSTQKPVDLVLSVDGLWQDSPETTWPENGKPHTFTSRKVHLSGDCKPSQPPTTPATPTTPTTAPPSSRTPTPIPSASSSAPGLPVTGSSNTLPMVGTGAALIAGGAGLVVALRRRR